MVRIVHFLWDEWKALETQVAELRNDIDQLAKQEEPCRRLLSVPGVGTLIATAIVATIGNGSAFRKGRDFARDLLGAAPTIHRRKAEAPSESASEEIATCAGSLFTAPGLW
jgi:transposase